MYVYGCNAILATAKKNRSHKEMMQSFKDLTEDLNICRINPGFHLMDNELSTVLKTKMASMNIKYQLVPQNNHRAKNAERAIQILQKPLHRETAQLRQRLPSATVGQNITTGNNQQKSDKTIKNTSTPISLYQLIWRIIFQPHIVSPTWDTSIHFY